MLFCFSFHVICIHCSRHNHTFHNFQFQRQSYVVYLMLTRSSHPDLLHFVGIYHGTYCIADTVYQGCKAPPSKETFQIHQPLQATPISPTVTVHRGLRPAPKLGLSGTN